LQHHRARVGAGVQNCRAFRADRPNAATLVLRLLTTLLTPFGSFPSPSETCLSLVSVFRQSWGRENDGPLLESEAKKADLDRAFKVTRLQFESRVAMKERAGGDWPIGASPCSGVSWTNRDQAPGQRAKTGGGTKMCRAVILPGIVRGETMPRIGSMAYHRASGQYARAAKNNLQ
jgi:hypothetical protein